MPLGVAAAQYAIETWSALRRLCGSRRCQALLVLGLANLVGGLVLGGAGHIPATRLMLELVAANYAVFVWGVVVIGSGLVMADHQDRCGRALATRTTAVACFALLALILAALAGIGYQLARGHLHVELPLYVFGLALSIGWSSLHLAALAVFAHALIRRRWLAMAATATVFVGTNLAFDHDLLRFGAGMASWSDMDGYGHRLGRHIALGLYWTGLCAALLAGAQLSAARSSADLRRRLTPNVVAMGWGGLVAAGVTAGWLLLDAGNDNDVVRPVSANVVQPAYSRLDLEVDVDPDAGRLRSRGTAILVNRHGAAIADVYFVVPPELVVGALSVTGEALPGDASERIRGYRLNRPLEPGETLKATFDLHSRPGRRLDGVRGNGTFLTIADIVPAIGAGAAEAFFATAPPVAFGIRLGTALEQTPVAPGAVQRAWKEDGARYVEYRTAHPIRPLASIHSARYAVARSDWQGVAIEVYHHPAHRHAVPRMVAEAAKRLEGLTRTAPYPHPHFRVVEVADDAALFGLPGLLGFNPRHRSAAARLATQPAWAGVLPYSELAALIQSVGDPSIR